MPFQSGVDIRLHPEQFRLLRDLFNEHAGLRYDDGAAHMFERRLVDRVAELGVDSFEDYYRHLRFAPTGRQELDEAIELLTTKETYFFRQEYQLNAFKKELLPELRRQHESKRRLTIWSAGCATGEEVYTIAILMYESGLFDHWDVRIVGSDISRLAVAAARRGVYSENAFRTTSPEQRRKYFKECADGMQVVDHIKSLCHFGQLNLLEAERAAIVGRAEVVFCRNVLIYFDARSRRRVIEALYERLVPGGYLLLGHSESLLNVTTAFELVHLKEDLVYRKPLASNRWER